MRAPRTVVSALLALIALGGLASATLVVRLDLSELVARSSLIVEGRCLSVTGLRDPSGVLVTEVELLVDRGRRGARDGEILRFRLPGGELGGRRLVIPGLPSFAPGDEVFLFLTAPSSRGWRMPVGLGQGLYRLRRDPATGDRRLLRDLTGLELVDAVTGATVDVARRQTLAYTTLVEQVQALLERDR